MALCGPCGFHSNLMINFHALLSKKNYSIAFAKGKGPKNPKTKQ
jgi:hypothetical protein